jgi:flagellar hook assembly protein FlgD
MIQYRLGPFENGLHTLTLKAWDVLNNSSETTIEFLVDAGARLALSQVQSRPNPYKESSSFYFEHNKPGAVLDVTINLFNLTGQHMTTLNYTIQPESTSSDLLYWDGKDESGNELSAGLYVYTITVRSDDGYFESISQKLLHFR